MKILLICAGGMSTSILMKKLERYAGEHGIEAEVKAVGLSDTEYVDRAKNYDCILMGPQVSFRIDEVRKATGKPVAAIEPTDYALGTADKIFALAQNIIVDG